jgi:rhodanese-related sulfurtransferase
MGLFDKLFNKPQEAAPAPKPAPDDWADQGTPQELQPAEVRARLAGDNPPVLLDVRNPHELQADGYIPGSVLIPMPEIEARWQELDPAKPTVVYCRSGMRSFDVGFFLIEKGFKDVSNLNGGILAWDGEIQRG